MSAHFSSVSLVRFCLSLFRFSSDDRPLETDFENFRCGTRFVSLAGGSKFPRKRTAESASEPANGSCVTALKKTQKWQFPARALLGRQFQRVALLFQDRRQSSRSFHSTSRPPRANARDETREFAPEILDRGLFRTHTRAHTRGRPASLRSREKSRAAHRWRFFATRQSRNRRLISLRRTHARKARTRSPTSDMVNDGKSSSVWSVEEDAELARLQVRPSQVAL